MFTTIKKEERMMKKGERMDEIYIIHRHANIEVKYPKDCWRFTEMALKDNGEVDYVEVQVRNNPGESDRHTTIRVPVEDFWYRNAEACMAYCREENIPRSAYKHLYKHRLYKHRVTSNDGTIKPRKYYFWEDDSECSGNLDELEEEHLENGDKGYVETSTDEDDSRGDDSNSSSNDDDEDDDEDDNDNDNDDGNDGNRKRKLTEEEREKKQKRARLIRKRIARKARRIRDGGKTKLSAGIKGRKFLARTDLAKK